MGLSMTGGLQCSQDGMDFEKYSCEPERNLIVSDGNRRQLLGTYIFCQIWCHVNAWRVWTPQTKSWNYTLHTGHKNL